MVAKTLEAGQAVLETTVAKMGGTGAGVAVLKGQGAIVGAAADLIQNGAPKTAADWASVGIKNGITWGTGLAAGALAAPLGPVGAGVVGYGASVAVDGLAGRVADGLTGSNRYGGGTSPSSLGNAPSLGGLGAP